VNAEAGRLYATHYAISVRRWYARSVKVRDLITLIEADGWFEVRTKGSHRQFRHRTKPGTVTVAGKPGVDLPPGTLNSVLKQAGLKR
jgi:predicted RNA binding protein YcfA (HicA-like mRNA interferase family)